LWAAAQMAAALGLSLVDFLKRMMTQHPPMRVMIRGAVVERSR
jgi:hypothetical protein